jgi:methylmalonyl-CoA mutase N-terminal domain/subunit
VSSRSDASLDRNAWRQRAAAVHGESAPQLGWKTPEGIELSPLYNAEDLEGLDHLDAGPAALPARPLPDDVRERPWTVRQYAGFSTAEESNAFYRRNLAAGQKGLSSPSISRPTAATTAIIRASRATSAWPASRSIRSTTCARCSTASRSTR